MTERSTVFDQIEQRRFMNESVAEITADLGVSSSSFYRWQKAREIDQRKVGVGRTIGINEAINRLCSFEETVSFIIVEAIFYFNAWLRWPTQPQSCYFAVTAGVFQYLSQKYGSTSVHDLNADLREGIVAHINLRAFAEMCSGVFETYASFDQHNIMGQPYTELDAVADLAWFLLAYKKPGSKKLPRFIDAYEAIIKGVDKYKFEMSESTFRKFWHDMLPSSAFLYAQNYHSSLTWTLDPFASHLVEEVDEIIRDAHARRSFFTVAFTALNLLQGRTDRRSWASYNLPIRPVSLEKSSLVVKPLPASKRTRNWVKPDKK